MPDQHSKENSPLEIYETAYRLHYIDNRIAEAVKYYEILIREFPDSNECGYAAVQIQKIKANGLISELNNSSKAKQSLTILAFVLSIISILLSASVSYYFYSRYKTEQSRIKLALTALSKVYIGDDNEALRVLTELKINGKNDIMPFELSSDLYQKKGLYEQARSEYEIFFRLNPSLKPTTLQLSKMKAQPQSPKPPVTQKTGVKEAENLKPENQKNSLPENNTSSSEPEPASRDKSSKKRPPQQNQKPIKGIFLVDPDSISFF